MTRIHINRLPPPQTQTQTHRQRQRAAETVQKTCVMLAIFCLITSEEEDAHSHQTPHLHTYIHINVCIGFRCICI